MAKVIKDLGAVTAYAYAVEQGYQGTEEEFAALLASYAEVAESAAQSAAEAAQSATAAETAQEGAEDARDAAQVALSQASAAASNAAVSATSASQSAAAASSDEYSAATSKYQAIDARDRAEAAKTAAQSAQGAAESAQSAAQSAATNAGTSATNAAGSAASAAQSATNAAASAASAAQTLNSVQAEGAAQIAAIDAEGEEVLGDIQTEAATQIAAIDTEGQRVLDSIPADYSQMEEDVTGLKSTVSVLVKNVIDSPAILQQIVATGHISDYLDIGDVIYIPWTDNGGSSPVAYDYPFVVVHFGDVYDQNGDEHENALWLMAMYATPRDIAFDAAESTPVDLTQEPNALEGWYYWGVDGTTYTELNLSAGDAIPTTYPSIVKCGINDALALRYGYNRWKDSAYRQWLNSDAGKGEGWWTEQHLGDRPPAAAQLSLPGWLDGFTDEWKAIFKPVKVDTACNTSTDGGVTDITYDTFFLPSLEQMYGAPQAAGVEGDYWEYWKDETGLNAPSNGSNSNTNDARMIPSIANPTGGAVSCRLRSAYRTIANSAWYLASPGYLNSNGVSNAYRALPACVIY